jgi:hypothetical protein
MNEPERVERDDAKLKDECAKNWSKSMSPDIAPNKPVCDHMIGLEMNCDNGYDIVYFSCKDTWIKDRIFAYCPKCGVKL